MQTPRLAEIVPRLALFPKPEIMTSVARKEPGKRFGTSLGQFTPILEGSFLRKSDTEVLVEDFLGVGRNTVRPVSDRAKHVRQVISVSPKKASRICRSHS
jgi:hypothetical protein